MLPSKEKIEEIIKGHQKIMRLQDWTIELYLVNQYEMKDTMKADHFDHIGSCKRFPNQRLAHIRLNIDHSKIDDCWYDTVVHEMLHIYTCVLEDIAANCMDRDDYSYKHFEYETEGVNIAFERIFVSLYPVTNFIKEVENVTE
jgi:hypothetical protein